MPSTSCASSSIFGVCLPRVRVLQVVSGATPTNENSKKKYFLKMNIRKNVRGKSGGKDSPKREFSSSETSSSSAVSFISKLFWTLSLESLSFSPLESSRENETSLLDRVSLPPRAGLGRF